MSIHSRCGSSRQILCKGICRKCGKNLNEGACGCDDSVPDPRMSVIQDIFKQFKEV